MVLNWGVVKEGDDFDFAYGTGAFLKHKPSMTKRGPAIGYYVMATLRHGEQSFLYMSAQECLEHGQKHSKTWISKEYDAKQQKMVDVPPHFQKDSPWVSDTDSMSLKTVLIQLSKLLPLSFEVQQALQADETSRDYKEGVRDAMEMPETTNWDKAEDAQTKSEKNEWEKEDEAKGQKAQSV